MTVLRACDGCGLLSASEPAKHINLTNGGLDLCPQCLSDINRKSPLLAAERESRALAVRAAVEAEREANAQTAEGFGDGTGESADVVCCIIANAIRARAKP